MKRIGMWVVALALGTSGIASAQEHGAAPKWNDDAAKAARAAVAQGLAAVERFDAEALRGLCTTDLVAYDIDLEGKPIRMGSLDEAISYVGGISAEAKKMGAHVKFENVEYNCRATSDVAYCLLAYAFVATMPDGARSVQPSQTTVVLTKTGGGWKWAHWHTSLSAAPSQSEATAK